MYSVVYPVQDRYRYIEYDQLQRFCMYTPAEVVRTYVPTRYLGTNVCIPSLAPCKQTRT